MEKMIAICGLGCHNCGAFLATKNNDDSKREMVAQEWSKMYNADIKAGDIYCDGCRSEGGYLFSHCHVCELRKCGMERGVENCAHCSDYTCEKLEKFFQMAPEAKTALTEIRNNIAAG